jgi:hypothetical protein
MQHLNTLTLAAGALAAVLAAVPAQAATIVADSVSDYTTAAQGEGGWHYGWAEGELAAYAARAFQPMPAPAGGVWREGGAQVYALGQQPQAARLAVRRWVAPAGGTYRVAGTVSHVGGPGSDGVAARIVRNGTTLWQAAIPAAGSQDYAISVRLAAGQGLDFVLGAGAAGDDRDDATDFSATISRR